MNAERSSGGRASFQKLSLSLVVGLAGCGFQLAKVQTREGDDSKSRGDGADAGQQSQVLFPEPEQKHRRIGANQRLDSHQGTCPIILHETSLKGVRVRSALSPGFGCQPQKCSVSILSPERGGATEASTTKNCLLA
jgi:hypothetical protein